MNRKQKKMFVFFASLVAVLFISLFAYQSNAKADATSDSEVSQTNVSQANTQASEVNSGDTTSNSVDTNSVTANATTSPVLSNPDPNQTEIDNSQLSTSAAEEGMVLLQNNDQTLPISTNESVALFGAGAYGTVKGGEQVQVMSTQEMLSTFGMV